MSGVSGASSIALRAGTTGLLLAVAVQKSAVFSYPDVSHRVYRLQRRDDVEYVVVLDLLGAFSHHGKRFCRPADQ